MSNIKKMTIYLLGAGLLVTSCFMLPKFKEVLYAVVDETEMKGQSYSDQSGLFLSMDEDGNIKYIKPELETVVEDTTLPEEKDKDVSFDVVKDYGKGKETVASFDSLDEAQDEAENVERAQKKARSAIKSDIAVYSDTMLRSTTQTSVVRFKNTGETISYNEVGTNIKGYTAANYAVDGAYLGTESNGKVRFKMAGVTALVAASQVQIVPYNSTLNLSYYKASGGYLYHYISTNLYGTSASSAQCVGRTPSYLKENIKYFSYDGHYFYTSYATMCTDYKNDAVKNAINASSPYYNYYQFLSHRTTTSFTSTQFESMIKAGVGSSKSVMLGTGKYFTQYQNTYGVNGVLMLGVAINESAWGKSEIAMDKNNMFGHNAVDSNPYWGADGYPSAHYGIMEHAESWVSKGYVFPYDWRYYGPHLGDKQSGMNVEYASDPYWGEKAAAQAYSLEKRVNKNDTTKYKLAINTGESPVYVYSNIGDSDRDALYRTGNANGKVIHQFPYVILDTVTKNGVKWYKIQADGAVDTTRSEINKSVGYSFARSYGYIKATSAIKIVNATSDSGSGSGGSNNNPGDIVTYKKGDVNGDGKISILDYLAIKNHIMEYKKLTGATLKRADVNQDGKVSVLDYIAIKNHIMEIEYLN